jgi:hypothetical protein
LPVDAHDALVEREVVELNVNGLEHAGASADQKPSEGSVMGYARIEIGLDLVKPQVVELASINGQRRNGRAGVAGDQPTAARFV